MNAVLNAIEAAEPVTADGVIMLRGCDLTPQPVLWLWSGWLAICKLHILAGPPGQGKTTLAMAMLATVTVGGRWPDGSRCGVGNIVVWSGEDDPRDTLLPRLMAAGADESRCYFVSATRVDGEETPFDPARDLGQLMAAMEKIGDVRMVLVDPVVSAVSGDSHKNTEVRRSLQPLVDMGSACGCAVLGITHFSKGGQGQDPSQRVVGSVAFSAVARVVMVAARAKSADGEECRILARSKSNIGPDDGGFEYDLEQLEVQPGIHASRVVWGKQVDGNARDLLTEPEAVDDESGDVVAMLEAELTAATWTNSDMASKPLLRAGFSKKQIWRAGNKLGIERKKGGMKDGWYWRLREGSSPAETPEDSAEGSQDSNISNGESSESSGLQEPSERELL